jgi:hypothetical protein
LTSYSFNGNVDLDSMAMSMLATGFQATNVGLAINEINRMVHAHAPSLGTRSISRNKYLYRIAAVLAIERSPHS